MSENPLHTFTLLLEGPDVTDAEVFDALSEAGCDDALFGHRDAMQYADFDRQAPTRSEAVASAIRQVESVEGMHVLRVSS